MTVRIQDGISISVRGLERHLTRREVSKLLENLALQGKAAILQRTAEGRDANENSFKPYSESYKEYRSKKGRPTGTPDLNFTGRMLGGMRTGLTGVRAQIFFARKEEAAKAAGHSLGLGRLKKSKREFFALSHKDIKELDQEVLAWFDELLANA